MDTVVASQEFLAAEAKGRRLLATLEQKLQQSGPDVQRADLDISYHQQSYDSSVELEKVFTNALNIESVDIHDWTHVAVSHSPTSEVAYSNFFHPVEGSIICFDNDKTRDGNIPEKRIEWSDVMYQVYKQQAIEKQQPISKLRTIWRYHIINADTRKIIGEAETFGSPNVGRFYTEYTRSDLRDSGFFALLGEHN